MKQMQVLLENPLHISLDMLSFNKLMYLTVTSDSSPSIQMQHNQDVTPDVSAQANSDLVTVSLPVQMCEATGMLPKFGFAIISHQHAPLSNVGKIPDFSEALLMEKF